MEPHFADIPEKLTSTIMQMLCLVHNATSIDLIIIRTLMWSPCYCIKQTLGLPPIVSLSIQTHLHRICLSKKIRLTKWQELKASYSTTSALKLQTSVLVALSSFHVLHLWGHRSHSIIGYSSKPHPPFFNNVTPWDPVQVAGLARYPLFRDYWSVMGGLPL